MHSKRAFLTGAVALVAAALAAGCGGSSNSGSESTAASTSGNAASSSGGRTVTIKETEYKLTPGSVTLDKTGTYTFKVVNTGSTTHALEIEGNGVEEESGHVEPGQAKTFTVDLKAAGKYEMYCPIDGHRQQGMEGDLTVGSAGGTGTTSDTSTTQTQTHGGGY